MYPTENTVYIPGKTLDPRPITIEEVRKHGRIVALSPDETRATVEVNLDGVISYCGVLLNEDRSIKDFIPRKLNTYAKNAPVKETPQDANQG